MIPSSCMRELIRSIRRIRLGTKRRASAFIEALLRDHGMRSERYEQTPADAPDRAACGVERGPPLVLYGHVTS